jgi:hypothetical protein
VDAVNRKELLMFRKPLAIASMVVGLSLGSYGVAAASGGSSTETATTTVAAAPSTPPAAPPGASRSNPWGNQRSDETPLTGDALAKVKAAALAKIGDATVVRIETDADGHAKYEAHMVESDGTPVTVYVDDSYDVVDVESR